MARPRHLNNAPITEALIDIRVRVSKDYKPQKFLDVSNDMFTRYPKREARQLITGSFRIEPGKPVSQQHENKGIQGYIYKSADEKNITQFRIDGFTFSRLHPYTKWESVLMEAQSLWKLYSSLSQPELITRIAVRYINRLDLPLPVEDLTDYLTAPPTIPDSLPQEVSQFFTRIVIHESDMMANIVQTLQSSPKSDHIGIIFDIDVFKTKESGFNEASIWSEFEQLRVFKNRIFFESITEKTARLYK